MIIECVKNNGYIDKFYLPDVDDLDTLSEISKKDMPIYAYEMKINWGDFYIFEDTKQCYIYLNNYYYFKEADESCILISQANYDSLKNTYCHKCINDGNYGCEKCTKKITEYKCDGFVEKRIEKPLLFKRIFKK